MSRGILYMGLAALSFSLMAVCVKLGAGVLPEQQLILFRSLFIIAVVLPILRRRGASVFGRNRPLLLLRGLMGYVAMSCYFWTLGVMDVADAMAVQYMSPLFTVIWASLFLGESTGRRVLFVGLLCLTGMLLVVRPTGESSMLTAGIGFAGAALAGGAYTTVRALRQSDDPYTVVFYFPLVSLPFSLAFSLASWTVPDSLQTWGLIGGVCLFSYGGQVFLTKGLAMEEAPRAILVNYTSIGLGVLFGLLIYDTVPSLTSILGILLILIGVTLISRR